VCSSRWLKPNLLYLPQSWHRSKNRHKKTTQSIQTQTFAASELVFCFAFLCSAFSCPAISCPAFSAPPKFVLTNRHRLLLLAPPLTGWLKTIKSYGMRIISWDTSHIKRRVQTPANILHCFKTWNSPLPSSICVPLDLGSASNSSTPITLSDFVTRRCYSVPKSMYRNCPILTGMCTEVVWPYVPKRSLTCTEVVCTDVPK